MHEAVYGAAAPRQPSLMVWEERNHASNEGARLATLRLIVLRWAGAAGGIGGDEVAAVTGTKASLGWQGASAEEAGHGLRQSPPCLGIK